MLGRGLVWLGGGQWSAAHTAPARAERSAYAVSGGVVALVALLTWVVVTLALVAATTWPAVVAAVVGGLLGALVAAVLRALTTGPATRTGGWGRIAAACVLGLLVGEIATTVLLSGSVDRRLTEEAAAASTPAVVAAESQLTQAQAARTGLDTAVDDALAHRDAALVVARCEYNPTPECPTTSITGVPGAGPETTNSNKLLADAQAELLAAFDDRRAGIPATDAVVAAASGDLSAAKADAAANVDTGLGSRWVAMNSYTLSTPSAAALRVLTDGVFVFLALLPLLLRRWRGETGLDRQIAVDTALDRARTEAELRQIGPAPTDVIEGTIVEEGTGLEPSNELVSNNRATSDRTPALPGPLPALTRFVQPLVPPVVANVVGGAVNTARNPIRAVRQVIEEVSEVTEITYTKRTRRVTVHTAQTPTTEAPDPAQAAEHAVIDGAADDTPGLEPRAGRRAVGPRRAVALLTRRTPRELPPAP